MDILDKIIKLREARHWSEYQLAERSGLTQSTISSWYCKNMQPSLHSLAKVCEAFDLTMSQFFMDENSTAIELTRKQTELLDECAKLTPEQYDKLLEFLHSL